MMVRATKTLASIAVAVLVLFLALPHVLQSYESRTRAELLGIASKELKADATLPEIEAFLGQHAEVVDDRMFRPNEVIGIMPQSRLDRWLFDRQVQIVVEVDSSGRYSGIDIRFYYTGL